MKIFYVIKLKHLGTKTRFALEPLNPFYEYNNYPVEVRELGRKKFQLENDVSMEQKTQQSDCEED